MSKKKACVAAVIAALCAAAVLVWFAKPRSRLTKMTGVVTDLSQGLVFARGLLPWRTDPALTGIMITMDPANPATPMAVEYHFASGDDVFSVSCDNHAMMASLRVRGLRYMTQKDPLPPAQVLDPGVDRIGYVAAYKSAVEVSSNSIGANPGKWVRAELRNLPIGPVWEVSFLDKRLSVLLDASNGRVIK